ncbi:MAG: MGMT family protein [Gemmatimonadetes bacterium]|nr:MGMT family protein [Gemmatimonadota bacterium]
MRARIYEAVRRIPVGKVATYGQVATLAGARGHARQVGYALHDLPDGAEVPWHRVINARGEISVRSSPGADVDQKSLLEAEGVEFDAHGKIDLSRFRWRARPVPWE